MEYKYSSVPMQRTNKIIRRSIFIFLQNYQLFTTTAALFAFPFAASALLLQSFVPSSSFFPIIQNRLQSLFDSAGLPSSSKLFTILSYNLSQTIAISFLAFPFTISSLLFSKVSIIEALADQKTAKKFEFSSLFARYSSILFTQLCNSLVTISANATCFTLLFLAYNLDDYGFRHSSSRFNLLISVTGVLICSIILANALIICNLALIISGMEKIEGYIAILKACVLIRGRTVTALSLAIPVNLVMAAIEALFQYRIVKAYHHKKTGLSCSIVLEGMFIAYLYAIVLVLDTIFSCVFYKNYKTALQRDEYGFFRYRNEIEDKDYHAILRIKTTEELPRNLS